MEVQTPKLQYVVSVRLVPSFFLLEYIANSIQSYFQSHGQPVDVYIFRIKTIRSPQPSSKYLFTLIFSNQIPATTPTDYVLFFLYRQVTPPSIQFSELETYKQNLVFALDIPLVIESYSFHLLKMSAKCVLSPPSASPVL